MNDRIYPKNLLKNAIAEERALELKRDIKAITEELVKLHNKVALKAGELEDVCPHTRTKTISGEISGDYYNKGTYYTIKKCRICGKELSRKESPSSYG